ncbi:MAG: hypothetical protein IMZ50_01540 [Candidatus Atribacteria bacterium]|nr:hypothetical protein [Candidatus Atribacteria bacterium]
MTIDNLRKTNDEIRSAWDANAAFWDARMGEGNDSVNVLLLAGPVALLVGLPRSMSSGVGDSA